MGISKASVARIKAAVSPQGDGHNMLSQSGGKQAPKTVKRQAANAEKIQPSNTPRQGKGSASPKLPKRMSVKPTINLDPHHSPGRSVAPSLPKSRGGDSTKGVD